MKTRLENTREDFQEFDPVEPELDIIDETMMLSSASRLETTHKEKILKSAIIISILLHIGFFAGLPRLFGILPQQSLLKPGEKVTQVRLIEQPTNIPKPESTPPETNNVSDRDNFTEKERIPKTIPIPQTPMGTPEAMENKVASLMPPSAPEDFSSPEEEKQPQEEDIPKPEEPQKPSVQKKETKAPKSKTRDPEAKNAKPTRKNTKQSKVDLRPNADEIARGISSPSGIPDLHPDGELEEAVVDINTKEDRFFSYLLHLKRKIQGVWIYPSVAAKAGLGGSLTVEFSIANSGELLYVTLLDSSGHSILDESALKAIRSAAPYFPFPARMKAKKLRVRANFIYVTQNFFRNIM